MKKEIVALIPVREGSQRVKGKNFIEFSDGKSLLDIKIGHLRKAGCFDKIYISSDSARVAEIAKKNKVEFLKRDSLMCQADVLLSDVITHIMTTIPGDPIVTWALVTSPLFKNFAPAVKKFLEQKKNDSLVAVLPKKSFFLNAHGRGINYNPGWWHPYSQQLETYYEVTGACYIGAKSDMIKWNYWFGVKPFLFEVSSLESVDVDTQADYEFAQKIYKVQNA